MNLRTMQCGVAIITAIGNSPISISFTMVTNNHVLLFLIAPYVGRGNYVRNNNDECNQPFS